jgi:hypothetical protein
MSGHYETMISLLTEIAVQGQDRTAALDISRKRRDAAIIYAHNFQSFTPEQREEIDRYFGAVDRACKFTNAYRWHEQED